MNKKILKMVMITPPPPTHSVFDAAVRSCSSGVTSGCTYNGLPKFYCVGTSGSNHCAVGIHVCCCPIRPFKSQQHDVVKRMAHWTHALYRGWLWMIKNKGDF